MATDEAMTFLKSHKVVWAGKLGSHAYGTATEESDLDIRAVTTTQIHKVIDGFPCDKVIDRDFGDIDVVLQPVHRFVKLCMDANPNILDWLFIPEDCIIYATPCFRELILGNRETFLTKRLHARFRGYAESHFQKMQRGKTSHLGEKRRINLEKYGYSTKNAMHLIRLARMGCEALETGQYTVRRPDAQELLEIRAGKWEFARILQEGRDLLQRMDEALDKSALPEGNDPSIISALVAHYIQVEDTFWR